MLILRGEQGVRVNCNRVCVCLHSATFSSDFDGRVFLCRQDAEKVRQQEEGWPGESPVLAQRAAWEGWGGSSQVPFLLAERAR